MGHINTMGKTLQQRCNDEGINKTEICYKGKKEDCSSESEDSRFSGESFTRDEYPGKDPSRMAVSP